MKLALVLAVVAGALAAPAGASADVVWLCQPGVEPDPCHESLETTVYDTEGASRVENPPLAADPRFDCFYVYPTVSGQTSRNANKDKDDEVVAIARYQAARYSQTCRVWAPVYRQQTLAGLSAGGSTEALALAYSDVEEAWREYLAQHNNGRGFVLIGHSQGTRMLRQLLRKAIEPDPDARRRLVSALLLGGNVTVKAGERVGGDFQSTPACTSATQIGCVIAWSTFNETPPDNARYGRVPAEDESGFGFPAGPGYEILCTNPASLGANERAPLSTYLRSEPFPGVLGALLVEMYGGPPPSADTPWLQPQDHYTGRCEQREGANVLMLEPVGDARKLNPAPDPSWGLHLADANIALGDLVGIVSGQGEEYARNAPAPAAAKRCASRRVITVRVPRGARVTLGGRRVAVRRGRARIDLRGRPRGTASVRIVTARGGVRVRRFRTCARRP